MKAKRETKKEKHDRLSEVLADKLEQAIACYDDNDDVVFDALAMVLRNLAVERCGQQTGTKLTEIADNISDLML